MPALILGILLLLVQPMPMTVEQCLLRSGYSRAVPASEVTALRGYDAWAGQGETILQNAQQVGIVYLDDADGARRMVSFHVYAGGVYAFVYKHPDDPNRRLPGEPAGVWHGDCLLRIGV